MQGCFDFNSRYAANEHQIDLIPGASLPNRAPYRTNPEETKEIHRQVQELLDKGYVRESLSPCAVPVIFLRNPLSSRSCTGRGRIRFLGSVFTRDCS
jgi:hypothetical protein